MEHTPLSTLGEFGLIEHLRAFFPPQGEHTVLGVGDDCALLAPPAGCQTLVSTDILLQGVHFNLAYFPLEHLGYKAVAVNVSDIAAMNALPAHITLSLGLSSRMGVEEVEALYKGVRAACSEFGVDIIGGDTSTSLTGLVVSVTVIGYAQPERVVRRSGAKAGHLICLTGNVGASYMGLQLLERESRVLRANPEGSPVLHPYRYVLGRTLTPTPRLDTVKALAESGVVPSAMIDVSDGLSSELLHIAQSSGVGCRVFPERIPIDQQTLALAHEMHLDPITVALHGGEDYELLFTVPLEYEEVMRNSGVSMIGYTTAPSDGTVLVTSTGAEMELTAQGWNAFSVPA